MRHPSIVAEVGRYTVRQTSTGHYEVYREGNVYAERCAVIGYTGGIGLGKAITEAQRRTDLDNHDARMAPIVPTYPSLTETER